MTWKDNLSEGSRNAERLDSFRARETTFVQVCQRFGQLFDTTYYQPMSILVAVMLPSLLCVPMTLIRVPTWMALAVAVLPAWV